MQLHFSLSVQVDQEKFTKERSENMQLDKRYYIFRATITINGVKYYAKNYGKRAFKIYINR